MRRSWSRRHAPCSDSPRFAAELRAGHAATPRGRVIWLRRAWPVLVGRAPVPATLSCSVAEKAPQPARNRAVFIKGRSSEGVTLPSILEAAMGAQEKGQVGGVRVFRQLPFLPAPSFRVDENYPISGRTPPENARFVLAELVKPRRHIPCPDSPRCAAELRAGRASSRRGGSDCGLVLLRDKNPRIVLYGSAPTTVVRRLAFLEYTRQL